MKSIKQATRMCGIISKDITFVSLESLKERRKRLVQKKYLKKWWLKKKTQIGIRPTLKIPETKKNPWERKSKSHQDISN